MIERIGKLFDDCSVFAMDSSKSLVLAAEQVRLCFSVLKFDLGGYHTAIKSWVRQTVQKNREKPPPMRGFLRYGRFLKRLRIGIFWDVLTGFSTSAFNV
jgi:hypothetical protein